MDRGGEGMNTESSNLHPEQRLCPTDAIGLAWGDWKAKALNRLFLEQGRSGEPGKITAATARCAGSDYVGQPRAVRQRSRAGSLAFGASAGR